MGFSELATIGVDCSGKVDSLPMYMVAAKQDDCRVILVTSIPEWIRRKHRDWKFLAYACYAFTAIRPLFRKNPRDTVLLDRDFDADGLLKVQFHLERLLGEYFSLPKLPLVAVGDDADRPVWTADVLSRQARKGRVRISLRNPNIARELGVLLGHR